MPVSRLLVAGFLLVTAGMVLPFLMVIGVLPAPLWLSVVSYTASVSGLFLGVIGAAMLFGIRRREYLLEHPPEPPEADEVGPADLLSETPGGRA